MASSSPTTSVQSSMTLHLSTRPKMMAPRFKPKSAAAHRCCRMMMMTTAGGGAAAVPGTHLWSRRLALCAAHRESNKPGGLSSFDEARDYVWRLGLKEKSEWWEWERSGQRPFDVPSHPDRIYRDAGWVSWDDWLGVGRAGIHVEQFRPFEEARAYVQGLGLRNIKEWMLWSGSGQRPPDIPWAPDRSYADQWEGWEDWLSCNKV